MGEVTVDLAGVHQVAATLRAEHADGLQPGMSTAERQIQHGVRFGHATLSGEAEAAREAMSWVLKRYRDNGVRHLRDAESLVIALERILTEYADADALAGAQVRAIEDRLQDALATLNDADKPAPSHGHLR